jgi:hypothetical protein
MAQVKAMTESAGSFQRLRKGLPMPFSSHSAASSRTDRSGRSIGVCSQFPGAVGDRKMSGHGDRRHGKTLLNLLCGNQAVAATCKSDIDQGKIRVLASDQLNQLLTSARAADRPMAERSQRCPQMLGHQPVVFSDGDAQLPHSATPPGSSLMALPAYVQ